MTDAADPFEAIKIVFFQECDELLGDLEAGLLAIERGSADGETINAVFRAVHSVKGGAGAFGLDDLVRFAHVFETLLDEIRSGRKPNSSASGRSGSAATGAGAAPPWVSASSSATSPAERASSTGAPCPRAAAT